jgi:curli production assembly/transport component CsgG
LLQSYLKSYDEQMTTQPMAQADRELLPTGDMNVTPK